MRCVIPGRSVKLFAKSIHCLSKIGDELYLEALPQGLALRTVNSSRSAYACFMFHSTFFMSYEDGSNELPEEEEPDSVVKCKIAMKSCLTVFKSMSTIEKNVDRCKIELNLHDARLIFLLYCRHGITKTHNLTFQECETLQAVFSKDLCPNFITSQARALSETVIHFPNYQEELTFSVCPEMLKAKNYVEDDPDPNKVIRTEMTLVPEEFDNYQIGVDTEVTFCLKELRGILSFAEYAGQPINLHFETGGKPLVLSMDADSTYDADFVLATLVDHPQQSLSQAPSQTSAVTAANKPARREKTKATRNQGSAVSSNRRNNKNDEQQGVPNRNNGSQVPTTVGQSQTMEEITEESRAHDNNLSAAELDNFFGDSFPYQETEVPDQFRLLQAQCQPSLGESILSSGNANPKAGTVRNLRNRAAECMDDTDVDEFIPATPPSKKFKSMFFSSASDTKSKMSRQGVVLAPDTDDESD